MDNIKFAFNSSLFWKACAQQKCRLNYKLKHSARTTQLNFHIQVCYLPKWKCSFHTFASLLHKIFHMVIITNRYAANVALRQSRLCLFPTIAKAYKLLLTAAPTVCKDERSFSKLKFVKSWCRNTMSNNRLDALMLLACEKDLAERIDLRNISKTSLKTKHH